MPPYRVRGGAGGPLAGVLLLALAAVCGAQTVDIGDSQRPVRLNWQRGVRYVLQGEWSMAEQAWKRCLELEPSSADCRAGLKLLNRPPRIGTEREGAGAKAEALEHWLAGLRFFQENERAKAREEWTRCRELDPGNEDCARGLRRVQAAFPDPADLKKDAERHWTAGLQAYQMGEHSQARDEWALCRKSDPEHEHCWLGLRRLDAADPYLLPAGQLHVGGAGSGAEDPVGSMLLDIPFERGAADMTAEGERSLRTAVEKMALMPLSEIGVVGYADPAEEGAEALASGRAKWVARMLKDRTGRRVKELGHEVAENAPAKAAIYFISAGPVAAEPRR
ncbi:MAG: hypothetical protein ABII00_07355 [Elusimicrobiota bacterium]